MKRPTRARRDDRLTKDEKVKQLALLDGLDQEVKTFYARLFALNTGGEFHAFVEWCGVMQEHLNIVRGLVEMDIPAMTMNRHSGQPLPIPSYRISYLADKIECIFDHAIAVKGKT